MGEIREDRRSSTEIPEKWCFVGIVRKMSGLMAGLAGLWRVRGWFRRFWKKGIFRNPDLSIASTHRPDLSKKPENFDTSLPASCYFREIRRVYCPQSFDEQEQPLNNIAGLRRIHPAVHCHGIHIRRDLPQRPCKERELTEPLTEILDIDLRATCSRVKEC